MLASLLLFVPALCIVYTAIVQCKEYVDPYAKLRQSLRRFKAWNAENKFTTLYASKLNAEKTVVRCE